MGGWCPCPTPSWRRCAGQPAARRRAETGGRRPPWSSGGAPLRCRPRSPRRPFRAPLGRRACCICTMPSVGGPPGAPASPACPTPTPSLAPRLSAGRQARVHHPVRRRLHLPGGAGDAPQGGHRARALPQHRHPGVSERVGARAGVCWRRGRAGLAGAVWCPATRCSWPGVALAPCRPHPLPLPPPSLPTLPHPHHPPTPPSTAASARTSTCRA